MEGISITEVAKAIERIEVALHDNLEVKGELETLKKSLRSMEHLLFESTASSLGLAAVLSALMEKSGVEVTDADVQKMLERLTPPTELGTLNRERASTLYKAILDSAKTQ